MLLTLVLDCSVFSSLDCWWLEFLVVCSSELLDVVTVVSLFSSSSTWFDDDWVASDSLFLVPCVWAVSWSFVDWLFTCWSSFELELSVFDGWVASLDCEVTSFLSEIDSLICWSGCEASSLLYGFKSSLVELLVASWASCSDF